MAATNPIWLPLPFPVWKFHKVPDKFLINWQSPEKMFHKSTIPMQKSTDISYNVNCTVFAIKLMVATSTQKSLPALSLTPRPLGLSAPTQWNNGKHPAALASTMEFRTPLHQTAWPLWTGLLGGYGHLFGLRTFWPDFWYFAVFGNFLVLNFQIFSFSQVPYWAPNLCHSELSFCRVWITCEMRTIAIFSLTVYLKTNKRKVPRDPGLQALVKIIIHRYISVFSIIKIHINGREVSQQLLSHFSVIHKMMMTNEMKMIHSHIDYLLH